MEHFDTNNQEKPRDEDKAFFRFLFDSSIKTSKCEPAFLLIELRWLWRKSSSSLWWCAKCSAIQIGQKIRLPFKWQGNQANIFFRTISHHFMIHDANHINSSAKKWQCKAPIKSKVVHTSSNLKKQQNIATFVSHQVLISWNPWKIHELPTMRHQNLDVLSSQLSVSSLSRLDPHPPCSSARILQMHPSKPGAISWSR